MTELELIDQFTMVAVLMTIKEIILIAVCRSYQDGKVPLGNDRPKCAITLYVISWCITLWMIFINAPAAFAGFLAGVAWETVMYRVEPKKK